MMTLRTTFCLLALALAAVAQPIEPEKLNTLIEALTRLGPDAVNANPRLKDALVKVLVATRGTPQFVQLVQQFKVADQNASLIEVAAKHPTDEAGVTALRLVLASGDTAALAAAVRVAAPGTSFRMPGLRFGLQLGTRRLVARIGADRAPERRRSPHPRAFPSWHVLVR